MSFIHGKLSFASDSTYLLLFQSAFFHGFGVQCCLHNTQIPGLINQNHLLNYLLL